MSFQQLERSQGNVVGTSIEQNPGGGQLGVGAGIKRPIDAAHYQQQQTQQQPNPQQMNPGQIQQFMNQNPIAQNNTNGFLQPVGMYGLQPTFNQQQSLQQQGFQGYSQMAGQDGQVQLFYQAPQGSTGIIDPLLASQGQDINQQFQKRHCGNDNSNGFSPRPPVMHRSDSDGSDRTIGHEESPLPKTTKKTKGDRGTCVQADGVTYVWNITSKEYAQLMNDARHHFGRWFGLENENSDINNATHTNRSGTRDSEAVDRIVKAAFPFCDLVQNLNVRKDARAQVKKWFRHWQSETKKAAIKNLPNLLTKEFPPAEAILDEIRFKRYFSSRCNALSLNSVFKVLNSICNFKTIMADPNSEVARFYVQMYTELSWAVFECEDDKRNKATSDAEKREIDEVLFGKFRWMACSTRFQALTFDMMPFTEQTPSRNSQPKQLKTDKIKKISSFLNNFGNYEDAIYDRIEPVAVPPSAPVSAGAGQKPAPDQLVVAPSNLAGGNLPDSVPDVAPDQHSLDIADNEPIAELQETEKADAVDDSVHDGNGLTSSE